MAEVIRRTAVIESGANLSDAVAMKELLVVGVKVPSNINSAYALRYYGAVDGETFALVRDEFNNAKETVVTAGDYHLLNPADFAGLTHFKINTVDNAAANVAMAADTTFYITAR